MVCANGISLSYGTLTFICVVVLEVFFISVRTCMRVWERIVSQILAGDEVRQRKKLYFLVKSEVPNRES